ncbi:energy transducer TonB [Kistimonas asteriae]|uniref:energy transducer TonB n=1 Tax=Kistimonas asteriae TaxID=517724 RepID=UPI001BAC5ADB|nr:energy transducer TonB [Kistimonas asteriae]
MKRLLLLSMLLHLVAAWLLEPPVPDITTAKADKTYRIQLLAPQANTPMTVTDVPVTPPAADAAPQKPLPNKAAQKPPKSLASPRPAIVSETHSVARALPKKEHTTSDEPHHVKQVPPAISEAPQRGVSSSGEEDRQQHWLDALHARISAHQRYPTRARRRGQEGSITVNLSIDRTGYLMNAVIVDGKRVFHQPTLRAIQAALPLPPPNGPEHITLTINYRLKSAVSAL